MNYQRLNLLNQYKILRDLAKIRKDEYDIQYYNNLVKIVAEGYERDYELLTEEIDEEFSKEDCDFVWDTLEMYRAIHDSYYKIKKPTLACVIVVDLIHPMIANLVRITPDLAKYIICGVLCTVFVVDAILTVIQLIT